MLTLLLLAAAIGQAEPAEAAPPNVLFIVVDDLRPELGCYGDETAVTPQLDALAARGLRFDRAYCQQAVCSPSRTSVLTGLRPDSTQVYDLQKDFRDTVPDVVTLPEHFKNHGWQSEAIGKVYHNTVLDDEQSWSVPWTYGKGAYWRHPDNETLITGLREQGAAKGLKGEQLARASRGPAWEWAQVEDDEYPDGRTAAMARGRLKAFAESGEPFFLAVGFIRPHLPFCAPRKYWDLYDHDSLPLAADRTRPEGAPGWALTNWGELRSYHGIPPQGKVDAETERNLVHAYYACTSYIDALVGSLVKTLDETGLASNTVIVLWSDHGWKLGEYSCWSKHTNFELDTRVPMLIVAPGDHPRAAATDALVELVDLYPTLCELADLPVPDHVEGSSLVPLVEDPARTWATAAFSQYPRNTRIDGKTVRMMGDSMRTDRYRFTRWRHRNDPDQVVAYELYDHEVDPMEMRNLADDPNQAELVKQLDAQVRAGWRAARP
ncbi:MAG: sulfatase [Phycisphaerales bacterium]|nr:sulfatase [Phycisphaerales bacterium]